MNQVMNVTHRTGTLPGSADTSQVDRMPLYDRINQVGASQLCVQMGRPDNREPVATSSQPVQVPDTDAEDQQQLETMQHLRRNAQTIFMAFDSWTLHGPGYATPGEEEATVDHTADEIERLVYAIGRLLSSDRATSPPSYNLTWQAVELLCNIMQGILQRNKDQHTLASMSWHYQNGGSNNLYTRLMHQDPEIAGGGVFETLNAIGHDVLYEEHFVDTLKSLVGQVQQVNAGVSEGHMHECTRLLRRLREGQGAAGGRRRRRVESRGESSRGRARYG